MKKVFYLMLLAAFATGCATYYTSPNVNRFGVESQIVLNQANFRVVKHVEAVVEYNNPNYNRADIEKSAYAELLRKANLTGSQVLTNVVVEEVQQIDVLRGTQRVVASGTVIEFLDPNGNPIPSASLPDVDKQNADTTSPTTGNKNADTQLKAFEPVSIFYKWTDFTKQIAVKYNQTKQVEPIYDFNEDGWLSKEELDYIDYVISDQERAKNKEYLFDLAHKDYNHTVLRINR